MNNSVKQELLRDFEVPGRLWDLPNSHKFLQKWENSSSGLVPPNIMPRHELVAAERDYVLR